MKYFVCSGLQSGFDVHTKLSIVLFSFVAWQWFQAGECCRNFRRHDPVPEPASYNPYTLWIVARNTDRLPWCTHMEQLSRLIFLRLICVELLKVGAIRLFEIGASHIYVIVMERRDVPKHIASVAFHLPGCLLALFWPLPI